MSEHMKALQAVTDAGDMAVNDVYPTIQGEGCMTGVPMVIVRLHGCEVGCPFCDTKETWAMDPENRVGTLEQAVGTNQRWVVMSAWRLAEWVAMEWPAIRWILLTGGEPADQPAVPAFVQGARRFGKKVAIETSGTGESFLHYPLPDWICVSPKIAMPGGREVLSGPMRAANEVKHVVGRWEDIDRLDKLIADKGPLHPGAQVCLQPMSESKKATELCMKTCLERGWRLSIQTHKLIGVR